MISRPLRWNDEIVLIFCRPRIAYSGCVTSCMRRSEWISGYISSKQPHSPRCGGTRTGGVGIMPSARSAQCARGGAALGYLTDTSKKNGALRALPGHPHHVSSPLHRALPEPHGDFANALPDGHLAWPMLLSRSRASSKAGDAVVLDYRLLHGTTRTKHSIGAIAFYVIRPELERSSERNKGASYGTSGSARFRPKSRAGWPAADDEYCLDLTGLLRTSESIEFLPENFAVRRAESEFYMVAGRKMRRLSWSS